MSAANEEKTALDPAVAIARILAACPGRGKRESIEAVRRLRAELGLADPIPAVVVVGTNGKSSAATYLQRLLTASGTRTGLYVSPHLSDWAERVRIDGAPCDPGELAETLAEVHRRAPASGEDGGEIRFFDLLTLAAELILRRAGVSLAVFEAGIGGRFDAVRLLEPDLVLLTSVGIDHAEILGDRPEQILTEKILVAPPGATVLSWPLGELTGAAEELADATGFRLAWVEPESPSAAGPESRLPGFLRRDLDLATAAWRLTVADQGGAAGLRSPPVGAIDLAMAGRFEAGEREGVPYLLDAAHNEAAWAELGAELARRGTSAPLVAVVSVSPGKRRAGLIATLRSLPGLDHLIVTRHTSLPAAEPAAVAAELRDDGVEAEVVEDVGEATRLAFARARRAGGRVLFFGSTHLVGEVRSLLAIGAGRPEAGDGQE